MTYFVCSLAVFFSFELICYIHVASLFHQNYKKHKIIDIAHGLHHLYGGWNSSFQ